MLGTMKAIDPQSALPGEELAGRTSPDIRVRLHAATVRDLRRRRHLTGARWYDAVISAVCMSADFVECAEGGKRFQSIAEPEFSSLAK